MVEGVRIRVRVRVRVRAEMVEEVSGGAEWSGVQWSGVEWGGRAGRRGGGSGGGGGAGLGWAVLGGRAGGGGGGGEQGLYRAGRPRLDWTGLDGSVWVERGVDVGAAPDLSCSPPHHTAPALCPPIQNDSGADGAEGVEQTSEAILAAQQAERILKSNELETTLNLGELPAQIQRLNGRRR